MDFKDTDPTLSRPLVNDLQNAVWLAAYSEKNTEVGLRGTLKDKHALKEFISSVLLHSIVFVCKTPLMLFRLSKNNINEMQLQLKTQKYLILEFEVYI